MTKGAMVIGGVGVLAWALLIAATVALGANRADHVRWPDSGFGACDLPCWSHIMPGQTAFSEVVPLLSRTLPADTRLLVSGSQVDFWTQAANAPFYGYLYYGRGSVDNITMHLELPVGLLLERLGAPDCVLTETVNSGEQVIATYWDTANGMIAASVTVHNDHWNPNTRTQTLIIAESYPVCGTDAIQWRGFAPYTHYERWKTARR